MTRPSDKGPPLSHRRIWQLAGPVILSNLSVPLLSAVDTGVVGHLPGPIYLGAVAVGALIFQFVFWGFGFLRMATTGFVAQANGAGDDQEVRDIIVRAATMAIIISALLVALQNIIVWIALTLIDGSTAVETLAGDYFAIRIWATPATLLTYVTMGWLFGCQRMMTAMVLAITLNAINIALDLLFVPILGWGVPGVALATVIAEYVAAIIGGLVILRHFRTAKGVWRLRSALHRSHLLPMIRVNSDIFIRTLCLVLAFAWFTAQGAAANDNVLAANALLLTFLTFASYGLDGFAHAAETLVGQAVGAHDRAHYRRTVRLTTFWAFVVAVMFMLVFLLLGPLIITALSDIATVRNMAMVYLPWVIVMPLLAVWSFQLDGIFIGATRSAEMRNGMILSLLGMLAAGYGLAPLWGNHGLWLALSFFFILRAATLLIWLPRVDRTIGATNSGTPSPGGNDVRPD